MSGLVYRIGVGIRLVRLSVGVWGTPAFWDTIGWWHNEVHYTIPGLNEEKRMAVQLEMAFSDATLQSTSVSSYAHTNPSPSGWSVSKSSWGIPDVFLGSSGTSSVNSHISIKDGVMIVNPTISKGVGEWRWESITVRSASNPGILRQLLIGAVIGAKWVPDTKEPVSLGPEYDRLSEFIKELTTS